jgi:NAD-dependent dihydropyrimidine dehydrogenase PreA subunit
MIKYKSTGRNRHSTPHVILIAKNCEACWKCIDVCKHKVIGKINLLWHKHILFNDGASCTGCLRCVKACNSNAIQQIN